MRQTLSISSFKRGAAAVLAAALALGGIYVHSRVVDPRDINSDKSTFFDRKNYDVLFFGTSHVGRTIIPPQLYRDYGITSYNLGTNGQELYLTYYILRDAVRYHKPRLAVLDVYSCRLNYPDREEEIERAEFHNIFDNFPFSRNKARAANVLCGSDDKKNELLVPYSVYHNRWKECGFSFRRLWNEGSFSEKNKTGGFNPQFTIAKDVEAYESMRRISPEEYLADEDTDGIAYIRRFVSFCTESGIQPVLVYLPPACGVAQQREANSIRRIAAEMHVPYYNFLPNEARIIDSRTDFQNCHIWEENRTYDTLNNGNGHLNLSGAQKMTDCLGGILRRDFALPDHRGGRGSAAWEADYDKYRTFIHSKISSINNLDILLMACSFEGLHTTLYTAPGTEFDDVQQRLIDQLEGRISVIREYDGYARVIVTDERTGSIVADTSF